MNILLVSSFLPYPLTSGGHVRLYNLIKLLSKKHTITLVCEIRQYQSQQDIQELEKFCRKIITVPRIKQWTIKNIAKTCISKYPFLMIGHTSELMKRKISELLEQEKFDLIHVETFYVMQNLPKTSLPIVLAEHNIEYLVYQRFLNTLPLFSRYFLQIDILKMRYWEEYYWKYATRVVAVSAQEKKIINRSDTVVVPNGVDLNSFSFHNRSQFLTEKRVLFIGNFLWMENKDAASWIIKDLWPKIIAKYTPKTGSKLLLWIVGKKIPEQIKSLARNSDIIFDENAPADTPTIFKQAFLLLAPIRVAGGTSFKILEAMASGIPVVTTKLGVSGLDVSNNQDVLVADDAEGLVTHITRLCEDHDLYKNITREARQKIEKLYNWENIVQVLESVYQSVL